MIEHKKLEQISKKIDMIITDTEKDAQNFEGQPFNGKTVASYLGALGAQIHGIGTALNIVIKDQISDNITTEILKETLFPRDNFPHYKRPNTPAQMINNQIKNIHFKGITPNDVRFLYCPIGNIVSWNKNDHDQGYCAFCKKYLSELKNENAI